MIGIKFCPSISNISIISIINNVTGYIREHLCFSNPTDYELLVQEDSCDTESNHTESNHTQTDTTAIHEEILPDEIPRYPFSPWFYPQIASNNSIPLLSDQGPVG